jgi:Putative peptidoglycan binding domain
MTGQLTMFDAIGNDQFPPGADAYAGYVDGSLGDQPNFAYVVSAFPGAQHLSIAINPAHDADALDIESGAATPESAAGWYQRQKARGIARPCLYADASMMESDVVPVITAAGIARESVRLWSAHYTGSPHICGPSSCGATSIDMDATQWTSSAVVDGQARDLDQSLLLAGFFGDPKPAPVESWEDKLMATIPVIALGSENKQAVLNWQALLVAHGYDLGSSGQFGDGIDGAFGDVTRQRTVTFQAAKGLTQDGSVGPETWAAGLAA